MYGVAYVSRTDKLIGLFCKRALWKRLYSAIQTCNLIDPANRSHPIVKYMSLCDNLHTPIYETYCNALQRTATHCNTLRRTETHCDALRRTATHCDALQHTAIHCNALQHTAIHCNALEYTATEMRAGIHVCIYKCIYACTYNYLYAYIYT